jgi:hypothetical protein
LFVLGYHKQFVGLRDFLNSQSSIANRIEVIGKKDPMITGNFEVTVVETGQVLHSKKHAGQGKATTMAERKAILEQVEELLNEG